MIKQRQVDRALQGQSNIAKKVYEHTPISEPWRVFQISSALKEKTGAGCDIRTVTGCLNDMTDSGIIRRIGHDMYQRVPVQDHVVTKPALVKETVSDVETPVMPTLTAVDTAKPAVVEEPKIDTIGALAEVASGLMTMSRQIASLATRVEEISIQVLTEKEMTASQLEDFNKLRTLLKSLS